MDTCVRVIECGGQGPRRVDVFDKEVVECLETKPWGSRSDIALQLRKFAEANLPPNTKAIVYSVAGTIKNHNTIIACPNAHCLDGMYVGGKESNPPTFAVNDMEAAITGMAHFFPELNYFLGITWSTGIGVRVWKNKEILSDSEAGHICIDNSAYAPVCGCGKRGCAEAILGGNAITKFVLEQTWLRSEKILQGINPCRWLDIAYNDGKEWAVRHYREVIVPGMAAFLAILQTTLRLPAIVWKGTLGLKSFKDVNGLELAIRQEMKAKMSNPLWVDDVEFHFLQCPKDHEAYIGAAKIALSLL